MLAKINKSEVCSKTSDNQLFDNLITFEELLKMLKHQYSKTTVYRWIYREGMPHKKIKEKSWFPKGEVAQWLVRN